MDNSQKLNHISLCTGYGGIDLGLKRAGIPLRTITYVEIETFVCQNLVAKVEKELIDVAPIWTDLKSFEWELFSGKVDILSGGFPCQPFSAAGSKKGSEDPRHLWPFIVDGIKRLGRPPIVFFENVEGIISSKLKGNDWSDPEGTSVLHHVLNELERLGYEATAGIFSASEVGAPHRRKRVFILGVNSRLNEQGRGVVSKFLSKRNTRTVAYPKSRGVSQYVWEPPRVIFGEQKLEDPNNSRRTKDQQQPKEHRATRSVKRSDDKDHLGESDCEKLYGNDNEKTFTKSRRWKGSDGHDATTSTQRNVIQRQIEPSLGGSADGSADWVDFSELYKHCDNRTDELRMLGNGVVPETCERAFRTLWRSLADSNLGHDC